MQNNQLTTIYLVRHAESEHNVNQIIGADPHLTENGKKQAEILSKKLSAVNFDAIFTSTLSRTKETARIIVKNPKVEVVSTKDIDERNYGIYEGRPIAAFENDLKDVFEKMRNMNDEDVYSFRRYESCETDEEMMLRFTRFLEQIVERLAGETVLVVTHGILMRAFLIRMKYATYKILPPYAVENTGYIKLECNGSNFAIKYLEGVNKRL